MESCKAQKPFRFGLRRLSAADLGLPVKPVETPEAQEIVNEPESVQEPEVTEETIQEPAEPELTTQEESVGTLLETAGFSVKSVKKLAANNITTVEELQKYIETGATLESLSEIGAKFAKVIEEELKAWTTGTVDQSSQETITQDS